MNLLNALMRLYPREWRARYEEEFSALLEQHTLSLIDIVDVALGALDARLRPQVADSEVKSERRPLVSRASLTRWSGMAGMVGSALMLLGLLAVGVFSDSQYPYTYDGLDIAANSCFIAGVICSLAFVPGLMFAYGRQVRGIGQAGLLLAFIGLLSTGSGGAGNLADAIRGFEIDWWWSFFIVGLMGTLAGLGLFSLAGSMQNTLPSLGSKLVVIGGFGTLAVLLFSTGLILGIDFEATKSVLLTLSAAALMTFHTGLFLLGYALWNKGGLATRNTDPVVLV